MAPTTRIERLAKQCPVLPRAGATVEPDFNFRVAGFHKSEAPRKAIRAMEKAIANPRATDIQRESWRLAIIEIEHALRSQLEGEKRSA